MARRRKTEPKVPAKPQPKSLVRKSTRQKQGKKPQLEDATANGGEQQQQQQQQQPHITREKANSSAENSSDTNGKESPSTNSHESFSITDADEKLQTVCPDDLAEETTSYEEMEIELLEIKVEDTRESRTGNDECVNSVGYQAIERGLSVLRMSETDISDTQVRTSFPPVSDEPSLVDQSLSTKLIETGSLDELLPETQTETENDLYVKKIEQHSIDNKVICRMDLEDAKLGSSSSENSSDASKQCEPKADGENSGVRRSNRIKHIGLKKQRSRGRGLVVKPSPESQPDNKANAAIAATLLDPTAAAAAAEQLLVSRDNSGPNLVPTSIICDSDLTKPVKVKSRWRRSSELEMSSYWSTPHSNVAAVAAAATAAAAAAAAATAQNALVELSNTPPNEESSRIADSLLQSSESSAAAIASINDSIPSTVGAKICLPMIPEVDREMEERLSQFEHLKENLYLTERYTNKETKRMVCDCFLTEEEILRGELGCGDDCLNRLLMIECGSRCVVGDRCTNRRFQSCHYAKCQVFRTEKKGFGLRATSHLDAGEFIMEYVGEVVDSRDFRRRAKEYSKDKNRHYYFMALKSDQIIDATMKGNISRFINHSCDPNAETQKWTVSGELRIGFFTKKFVAAGEEITFDYHFQRYGKEAQKCFCEAINCRGWIGDNPEDGKTNLERMEESDESDTEDESDGDEEEEGEEEEKEAQQQLQLLQQQQQQQREKPVKPARRRRRRSKREENKLADMEDEDLEEQIERLCSSGLKNRVHTLTLSRLMVRCRELQHRRRLLEVIQSGEQPCRRLFLDYHGLRLMWSYMMDVAEDDCEEARQFRLEIIRTLTTLPIPNRTMLIDSKVLSVVEKWSQQQQQQQQQLYRLSPSGDSPEDEQRQQQQPLQQPKPAAEIASSSSSNGEEAEAKRENTIAKLAGSLLEGWSNLKEVFRIPKKERLEQMKEHEREADRGYKEDVAVAAAAGAAAAAAAAAESKEAYDRHRSQDKGGRRRGRESPGAEPKRPVEERSNLVQVPRMSKFERRQLFALKVAKEEEERQRRQQEELWQQHQAQCLALGIDPYATAAVDPQSGYPLFFEPQLAHWHQSAYPGQALPPAVAADGVLYQQQQQQQPSFEAQMLAPPPTQHNGATDSEQQPPPALDLPPKWKWARDKRGRVYYYHARERVSQWLPPPPDHIGLQPDSGPDSSSSEDDDDDDDDEDDDESSDESISSNDEHDHELGDVVQQQVQQREEPDDNEEQQQQQPLDETAKQPKRRRDGLVQERIISPRREEDRIDHSKFKETKDKLRRQKAKSRLQQLEQPEKIRKHRRSAKHAKQLKSFQTITSDMSPTTERKIKDTFRLNMAHVMVHFLNPYRKNDCKQGRITNTEDFKYLARKLTHFVLAKELKHCKSVDELECNENVKHKAKDFVRKYMNKFGAVYQRDKDED